MLVPRSEVGKPDAPPLQVKYQHVSVRIDNQVAVTSIEQVFVNNTKAPLEATYFFPISEQASIFDFAYYVKGERIAGQIREKDDARRQYDAIVARMRDPALLEQVGRNLFRAQIFPVSPDEPMRVELKYAEILPYDKGKIRYTYPLAMKGKATELADLTISVQVRDQKAIQKLYSETYDVDIVRKGPHEANVSYETTHITPTRDFSLVYEVESEDLSVNFVAYRPDPDKPGYFLLLMCPQEKTSAADVVKKDVIFVFDRSGSMKGDKMAQAKAAMKYCVENLSPDDRFNIITFSSDTTFFKDGLVAASKEMRKAAVDYIEGLEARGGTAINDALLAALKMFDDSRNQKTIIFCTDGLPTVGETDAGKIIQNVKEANRSNAHVFCFGVGDDVDDYLLLKLAAANWGIEQHVKNEESIEAKVSEFFDKVNTPLLVDLKLNFGGISTEMVHPKPLPDVFKGSQLVVAGRYRDAGTATITLTGELNGQQKTYKYKVQFPEKNTENAFVGRVWARKRVDYLVDLIRLEKENPEIRDEIIELSKEWTIQTPYTSFLAVPEKVSEEMLQAGGIVPPPVRPLIPDMAKADTVVPIPGDRTRDGLAVTGGPLPASPGPVLQAERGSVAVARGGMGAFGPTAGPAGPAGGPSVLAEQATESLPPAPPVGGAGAGAGGRLRERTEGTVAGGEASGTGRPTAGAEAASPLITRYQAAAALADAADRLGLKLDRGAPCPFADIPADRPERKAIAALVAANIIPAGATFDGDKPLLRRDFAVWASALLAATGLELKGREPMQVMQDEGILRGTAAGLQPDEPMRQSDFDLALSRVLRH
jgi:Ca-activated chloride channel family protein